jgi:hypothetical protein
LYIHASSLHELIVREADKDDLIGHFGVVKLWIYCMNISIGQR